MNDLPREVFFYYEQANCLGDNRNYRNFRTQLCIQIFIQNWNNRFNRGGSTVYFEKTYKRIAMFGLFKKKKEEPDYDVTNLTVRDLKQGFILDYDLKTWVVKEEYEYDWGDNNFSKEYMLDSGDDTIYLGVENRGELFITATKDIKLRVLGENIAEETAKNEKPPDRLVYENETYYLDSDSAGYFNDITKGTDDWEELISWEYLTEDETKIINITQWDERNFDSVAGVVIKEFSISNIVPAE